MKKVFTMKTFTSFFFVHTPCIDLSLTYVETLNVHTWYIGWWQAFVHNSMKCMHICLTLDINKHGVYKHDFRSWVLFCVEIFLIHLFIKGLHFYNKKKLIQVMKNRVHGPLGLLFYLFFSRSDTLPSTEPPPKVTQRSLSSWLTNTAALTFRMR